MFIIRDPGLRRDRAKNQELKTWFFALVSGFHCDTITSAVRKIAQIMNSLDLFCMTDPGGFLMAIQITCHNTEATEALRDVTNQKFAKLYKIVSSITSIHVIFKVDKNTHSAEATISVPGKQIVAHSDSENMYKTIDLLVDKLSRQLTSYKEKTSAE